jgi:hypothetical protein
MTDSMSEREWQSSTDPTPMLAHLASVSLDRRKRLLFAAACCRRLWQCLHGRPDSPLIETAGAFADARVTEEAVREALATANPPKPARSSPAYAQWELALRGRRHDGRLAVAELLAAALGPKGTTPVWDQKEQRALTKAVWEVQNRIARKTEGTRTFLSFDHARVKEAAQQAALVREVFGNPFRPVTIEPAWLTWSDGTIPKLARAIHDERAFDRLPILADALAEAGCTNDALLAHLRGAGLHEIGCWAVDLVRSVG